MYYNMLKKYSFIFLIVLLSFICLRIFVIVDNKESNESIYSTRKELKGHIANITINNVSGVYNNNDNSFYFYVNNLNDSKINNIKINSSIDLDYKIIDRNILNFTDGKLLLYNNKYYQNVNLKFVSIPIISISSTPNLKESLINKNQISNLAHDIMYKNNLQNDKMLITINTGDEHSNNNITYKMYGDYHVRGGSSLLYDKKSYKVNLSKSIFLFNQSFYNEFILDASYTDSSKIRNKLSSDLWNAINNNQNVNNDLYTSYVELYIDDEYQGLYIIKNSVDKYMLNLSSDGVLIKYETDINDFYINNLLSNNFKLNNNFFLNFEIKYSNNYQKSSELFVNRLKNVYDNDYSYKSVVNNYHIDNYVNYKVLIGLIMGVDNTTKNQYLSMQNSKDKLLITPWDMDLSFGDNWDVSSFNGESFDANSYLNGNWLDEYVLESNQLNNLIKQRYWELRKDTITMDNINKYLDEYKELLVSSGAAKRDSDRWYDYDIEYEIEQIRKWANNRIIFLDEYFKI